MTTSTVRSSLQREVSEDQLLEILGHHIHRVVPGTGISHFIAKNLPQSWRPKARVLATNLIQPYTRRKAAQLANQAGSLKLNLGCGTLPLTGWINVDLVGLPVDLAWNITKSLPFEDNSVDAIFHEHVMEHISGWAGYHFTKECFRVLKPNGVLRIVMPDGEKYMRSYVDPEHTFLFGWRGEKPTAMLSVTEEFYGFGHQAMYDYATVELFCRTIGFANVERSTFGESRIEPCPDCEWRITDSFYVEAVK